MLRRLPESEDRLPFTNHSRPSDLPIGSALPAVMPVTQSGPVLMREAFHFLEMPISDPVSLFGYAYAIQRNQRQSFFFLTNNLDHSVEMVSLL